VSLELLFVSAGTPPAAVAPQLAPAPGLRVLVTFSGSVETDITSDVTGLRITRGRSRERETMTPGRCEIDLWNFAGKYDPDNASGPYFPNIRPNKIVRVLALVNTTSSPFTIGQSSIGGGDAFAGGAAAEIALFTGRLEGGTLTFAEGGLQPRVTWRAIDASKRLNRDRSTTGYGITGDLTGERVNAVLDGATPTWPTTERDIAPGTRTVQASTGDAGRYDYMLEVAASEFGAFFISKEGWAIFRDSTWEPAPAIPVIGSGAGEYPFSTIETTDDEQEIFNAVTVTAPSLADQVAEDTGSEVEFGRSDLPVSTILDGIADMSDIATTLVDAYASPRRRISRLRVDRAAADWSFFLGRELQDRVTVRHRPVYGGTFEQLSVIQGIGIEVKGSQDWAVTWNLAPPLSVVSNPNLLTENQASMESDTSGWEKDSTDNPPGNGVYIEGLTGGSVPLVGVWALTGRAYGIPQIQGSYRTTPYNTAAVTVGEIYRASAYVRSYWSSVYFYVAIEWVTSGGANISWSTGGPFGLPLGGIEWVNGTVEGVAPATAAYGRVQVQIVENDGAHPHYIDAVSLRHVGA
jgi:hypothetical protein